MAESGNGEQSKGGLAEPEENPYRSPREPSENRVNTTKAVVMGCMAGPASIIAFVGTCFTTYVLNGDADILPFIVGGVASVGVWFLFYRLTPQE